MQIKFELRDLWVGLYWTKKRDLMYSWVDWYICLIPCFPIKFQTHFKYEPWIKSYNLKEGEQAEVIRKVLDKASVDKLYDGAEVPSIPIDLFYNK